MPSNPLAPSRPKASAQSVKDAAAVGDAIVAYYLKYGSFPSKDSVTSPSKINDTTCHPAK